MDTVFEQIRKRDRDAYRSCFREHYNWLVRFAHGYVYDTAASEDIVQEAFIYLWENAQKIEVNTSLPVCLLIMVKNRCLNYLKYLKFTDSLEILEFNAHLLIDPEERL